MTPKARRNLELVAVFVVTVLAYGWVEASAAFPDVDAFYHAKMALLTLGGPVREFSWLPLTVLADNFADHHFLYHLLIAPFVALGGLGGLKVATVLLAAAAVAVFHSVLLRLSVRHAAFFTFLLASSGPFVQRMNLVKATAPALIIIMLAVLSMQRGRRWPLFFLAWAYVLTHGSWPLLGVMAVLDVAAVLFSKGESSTRKWPIFWLQADSVTEVRSSLVRLIFTLSGLAFGLLVSPFFPNNLFFYWEQIVQVAVVGHQPCIAAGVEWLPFTAIDLFRNAGTVFVAGLILFLFWLVTFFWPETSIGSRLTSLERRLLMFSWMAAATTLLMTLNGRRHVEYFLPFFVLALAVTFSALHRRLKAERFIETLSRSLGYRFILPVLLIAMVGFFALMAVRSLTVNHSMHVRGQSFGRLSGVGRYIDRNIPVGSLVFHAAWEDFPALFLASDSHSYVSGLDPNFLYRADPALFDDWVSISEGRAEDPVGLVRGRFGASYVMASPGHPLGKSLLSDDSGRLLYADDEALLFQIIEK